MVLANSEQANYGLKTLKTGEDKFEIAIQDEKIINSPMESLKEVLRLAMLKLGIRGQNLPSDEEKYILLQHISENYGNHTPSEITLAFELAIAGKLYLEEKDIKAYENFSCLYFSTIMNAYRIWSREPMSKIREKQKRLQLPYGQRDNLSDDEMVEWINEWDKEKFISTDGIDYIPILFYEYLVKKGKIDLTNEQKKEYLDRAIVIREGELFRYSEKYSMRYHKEEYGNFKNERESQMFSSGTLNQLRNLAKKIAVFEYLKEKLNVTHI